MMEWPAAAALATAMALAVTILVDMVSRTFGLQSTGMWAKSEYAQIAVSALLIGFAAAMVGAGNAMAADITYAVAAQTSNTALQDAVTAAALNDPALIAKSYLKDGVIECQKKFFKVIFALNMLNEAVGSIQFEVRGYEGIGGRFVMGGFITLAKLIESGIVQLVMFEYVQYHFLTFIQYTMLPVFFPIGIVLRSFPVTRGAGGLIVAFSLGFAFVFPITYLLIIAMMPNTNSPLCQGGVQIDTEIPCMFNAGGQIQAVYKVRSTLGDRSKLMDDARGWLSLMYLQAFMYPLVSLIVTFTFIRQTGSLFGADLAEIGRGLIKII